MVDTPVLDVGKTYDEHAPKIYRYIFHRLGNVHLAEDLTSDVFVRFLRARVAPDNLLPYLFRCAHNVIVDYLRQNPEFLDPLDERVAAEYSDPARIAEAEAERSRLRHAIWRLTPDQQQVIVLKFVEGFSNEEIGQVLGKPEGAVKALQHRALVNMRTLLSSNVHGQGRLEFAGLLER